MLLPLSSLKVLAALRSSTRSLPRSQLACWGKLPELFFWLSSKRLNKGFLLFYPDHRANQHFGGGAGNFRRWKFGNCIWKCSPGNFFWKRPGNLCPGSGFPPKSVPRRRGPQDAKPTLAGPPFGLFPAREKPPPSGVRSFPLKIKCCIHLLPLERPRQRDRERVT